MYLAHHGRRASGARRFTGASLAVLVTALVGYALATGLNITPPVAASGPITYTALSEITPPLQDKPKFPNTAVGLTPLPPVPIPDDRFVIDDSDGIVAPAPGPTVIDFGNTGDLATPAPGPTSTGKRTVPALSRSALKPDYPIAAIRAQDEGVTTLALCISSQGRVMTASIASSSGHSRLDDAALKWVRTQRFNPATENGAPVATCAHTLAYEWKLENAR